MRSLLLAFACFVGLVTPAHAGWRWPVPGSVARAFAYGSDPFRAGWHRGVDLSARPGAVVRAACAGRVATARPGLVTLRCGPWRVTHLPLATVSVRRGEAVTAGRPVGTLGASADHAGLHLGVRRAGERFGYVDPLRFFGTSPPGAPPVPRVGTRPVPPAAAPRADPVPRGHPMPRAGPRPASPPAAATAPAAPRHPVPGEVRVFVPAGVRGLAPWPAWAGLALILLGAAGGGVRIGVRRRRARVRAAVPSAP